MTAATVARRPRIAAVRLLRLELRRNTVPWMLPLIAVVFWIVVYRRSMQYPAQWSVRAISMQTAAVSIFTPMVAGVAAWVGSREGRHRMAGQLESTARPRWTRQLAAWGATTAWALLAYALCVGALYASTAWQGAWGGPLWWPALVGAASIPAFAALGFAAGALRPSRFTAPLAAIAVFFGLEFSAELIHGFGSYWQVSPLVANPWSFGADEGVATFYRYLPDLPIAQTLFLTGLAAALLGALGLPAGAGDRRLRRTAAVLAVAGLLATGAGVTLAGTGRLDPHGLIAIPLLHDKADDRPVPYTPVCSATSIPICLHPAYAAYLPAVATALEPTLAQVVGVPGAPTSIGQAAAVYQADSGNGVDVRIAAGPGRGVYRLILPVQLPGPHPTTAQLAAEVESQAAGDIVANVIGGRDAGAAQQAVWDGIFGSYGREPDAAIAAAGRRFAALSPSARHAWLLVHATALRAGQLTLADLP